MTDTWAEAMRVHEAALVVGTRVECWPTECETPGHPPAVYGARGTIADMTVLDIDRETQHVYGVKFDREPEIHVDGVWWWGSIFAACELVPLPPSDEFSGQEA